MRYYIDVAHNSINKQGEELCGDHVETIRTEDGIIIVLADGLGSGVKANILASLTSKIAVTMLKEGASLEETIDTITHTLPECQVRKLAYSTFTIIKVYNDGMVYVVEYDNPPIFLHRLGRDRYIKKEISEFNGKVIQESRFQMESEDVLTVVSDGAVHAGVGKLLNFGWQWEHINDYLKDLSRLEKCSKNIAGQLLGVCENLYDKHPGDDTTVVTIKLQPPQIVQLFTGPPEHPDDDPWIIRRLLRSEGKIVICGGTTANIAARELGKEIEIDMENYTPDVPPMGKIEGIDLVTEGVLTLNKAIEIIKKHMTHGYDQDAFGKIEGKDGATRLAKLLLEECTHLHLWVGKAINPAHQNPNFPVDFNIKLKVVQELKKCLEFFGKDIELTYL